MSRPQSPTPARRLAALLIAASAAAFTPHARADEGMWLFNNPPAEAIKSRYGFEITPAWLEHLRKSAVRISEGGSGSFVSADGLVMTNHHVVSDLIQALSTKERDLSATGFYAPTPDKELRCPGVEMDVLWDIQDVTDRVQGAAAGLPEAEAGAARRKAVAAIEAEAKAATGLEPEVVTLYQGGRYHLYQYRRSDDVRLVFAPEPEAAYFGGDADNFEYPRFNLDCAFLRVYDHGKPLKPEHWLRFGPGAAEGDVVFVAGHPGSTKRDITAADFEHLRDDEAPRRLAEYWRTEIKCRTFAQRSREHARIVRGDLDGVANSRKAYTGIMAGLADPALLAAKREDERRLAEAAGVDPSRAVKLAQAMEAVERAAALERSFAPRYDLLVVRLPRAGSLMGRAVHLVRMAAELPKPSAERLAEYQDARLDSLKNELYSTAPVYDSLETAKIEWYLTRLVEILGGDDPAVETALGGKSPRARAEELVRGCTFKDPAARRALVEGGAAAIERSADPMLKLVAALDPEARDLRRKHEDEVEASRRSAYATIAAARFAAHGDKVYPDATFTLRLSYGTVKGYTEEGATVPPSTTFAGLFERAKERAGEDGFTLAPSWEKARASLDLATPFNFVSTCDIIGGNSGSPVVNRAGEVVGLIFDGNIQSLVWDLAYPEGGSGRAVAVDVRAITEALRKVYGADALVRELTGE